MAVNSFHLTLAYHMLLFCSSHLKNSTLQTVRQTVFLSLRTVNRKQSTRDSFLKRNDSSGAVHHSFSRIIVLFMFRGVSTKFCSPTADVEAEI